MSDDGDMKPSFKYLRNNFSGFEFKGNSFAFCDCGEQLYNKYKEIIAVDKDYTEYQVIYEMNDNESEHLYDINSPVYVKKYNSKDRPCWWMMTEEEYTNCINR